MDFLKSVLALLDLAPTTILDVSGAFNVALSKP